MRNRDEGHDAWQGTAYREKLVDQIEHGLGLPEGTLKAPVGEPGHLLKKIMEALPAERRKKLDGGAIHRAAMEHQANVNRAHPEFEQVAEARRKLVEHDEAKSHFARIQELLSEHHTDADTGRQLEIHAELRALQARLGEIEKDLLQG